MSGDYQTEFVALDVGDVNGDGKNEIVVAGRNAIRIFRKDGDVFSMINKIDLSRREYILALDIWDTDGDGVSEVIVSSLGSRHSATDVGGTHSNNVVSSFVIAYQDGVFKKRVEKLPWLLRVIDTDEGQKLVGQTLGLNYPFDNPIHEIVYQNGKYQQGKDLGISRGLSVYSLVLAKLDTQLPERVVSTNDDDYLCMYEKTTAHVSQLSIFGGSVNFVYKSNEYFGGSNSYIQYYGAPRLGETVDVRRVYINPRIIVTKALGEGKPRLILARNISPSGRVLQTMKTFTSSEMVAMEWDGLGIAELWRTRGIGGYVADFSFKDADNDGEKDLVLAIIKSAGSGMGEVSVIAIYKFARL
ncbi:MAG: VCBS repeat-containing protein [Deltaproteobacteria bacterium]|nr:VCBS repeat-containing protein [Deltaproteobacteria bacterium]